MSALQEELYHPINPLSSKHLRNCVDLQGSFESPYDDFTCETLVQYIFEDKFEETSTPRQKSQSQSSNQHFINSLIQSDDSLFESEDEPKSWWNSSELPTLVVCNEKNLKGLLGEVPVLDIADEELDEQISTIEEEIARIEEQKVIIRAATTHLLMEEAIAPSPSDSQLQSVLQDFFGSNESPASSSNNDGYQSGSSDSAQHSSVEDEDVEIEAEDPVESHLPVLIVKPAFPMEASSMSGSESTFNSPSTQTSPEISNTKKPGRLKRSTSTPISKNEGTKSKRRKPSSKESQPVININIELELLDLESSPLPTKSKGKNSQNCSYNSTSSKKKRTKLSPSKKKLLAKIFKEEKILKIKSEGLDQDQDEDVDIGNISDCTNY